MQNVINRSEESLLWRVGRELAKRTLPNSLMERRRAARKSELFRQAGVVFVHVPKAAGTSIATEVYAGHVGHFSIRNILEACPPDVLELPRFTIVRNSWERAVSAYEFVRSGSGFGGNTAKIRNASSYQREDCATFDRFVRSRLINHDVDRLDHVFRRQVFYTSMKDGTMPFDHIGYVDSMEDTEVWLSEALGRLIKFGHHNVSKKAAWRDYYTPDLVNIIGDLYHDDIQAFGFSY